MSLPSSFISSSDRTLTPARAAWLAVWTIVGLAAIDLLVGLLFPYPEDPKVTRVDPLTAYFDHGRSIEGKLRRITRSDPNLTAPITLSGWYRPLETKIQGGAADGPTVTVYGMSHSVRLAEALARTTDRYRSRSVGAPGATVNWAYGAYLRDTERQESDVSVLSLMSLNAPMVTAMSAMTWNSAFTMPYTSDRFVETRAVLRRVPLPYESFPDFVRTLNDRKAWEGALEHFARHDPYFDPLLFRQSIADESALAKLLRRGYAQRVQRLARERTLSDSGFEASSEEIRLLNAIVEKFAASVRREGGVPVIYLVNNLGYGDHLFQAVRPALEREKIAYVSSHDIVSTTDPRGYLPDTHFTDANDDRLAAALERAIAQDAMRNRPRD